MPVKRRRAAGRALAHCAAEGDAAVVLPSIDVGALLDATATAYGAWEGDLVEVDLPDPMMKDFIDGMKMTLRVQTAATGASCPMSQYTRTWARDNIGPTLALLDVGAHDDVRAMMDYVYGAIVLGGDLSNSYDADLDVSALPPPPDWDAMPPLEGRVAAETPSYMVWIYGAHHLATGDLGPAEARLPFLRRCLLAQAFSDEGLLPFTGDETYRTAMDAAFGLPLGFVHEEKTWSANSSLLWLGAAHHYVRLSTALGETADVAAAEARYAEVESALLTHYMLDDGCVSPFEDIETGEAWPTPFEDVALTVTWAGFRDGDDPLARGSLACVEKRLKMGPGEYRSPLAEGYTGNLLLDGATSIYTGMVPGYGLSSLCDAGHIEAADAVNFLGKSVGTSGDVQEYLIGDDHSGLSIIYDDSGNIGDYTAKLRPWEGGIDVSALLQYLVGFEPDRPARSLSLRPHLPVNWPSFAIRGLRAGDDRFDVELARDGARTTVRVTSHASEDYDLTVRLDAPEGAAPTVEVDGEALSEDTLQRFEHFRQQSVRTPALRLPAGGSALLAL